MGLNGTAYLVKNISFPYDKKILATILTPRSYFFKLKSTELINVIIPTLVGK